MDEKDKVYLRMDCVREAVKLAELTGENTDFKEILAGAKLFEEFLFEK